MAEIVNDRDVLLQAASVRKLTTAGVAIVPTPSSYNFYLRADGTHGPDYVRISVATILCDGPFTFAVQGAAKLSNVTATTADIAYADMTSALAIVTVTAANAGTPVQGSCIVGLVSDGQSGQPGQPGMRGAGTYYTTGSAWSDSVAKAACPAGVAIIGDVVTISNGTTYALTKKYDGSAWAALGGVYDGSLFVTGSIQAAAINTNGLTVRDLEGNIIIGVGSALNPNYAAAGTKNSDLVPSINSAGKTAVWADGIVGRPEDISNLVKKSSAEDGGIGGWYAQGWETKTGTNSSTVPYTRALLSNVRDCVESDNLVAVTPGETLYFGVWMNTQATGYECSFGAFIRALDGAVTQYALPCTVASGSGWVYKEGSVVVPPGSATAQPWLFQNGSSFVSGNWLRAAGMWIGRHARGATVGAPSGTLVGGTEAGLLASRALNGDSAYNALPGINNAIASKLSAGSRNVLAGGAGLAAGTLTWDASGNYTGGYGVAMNQRGIVAYNSNGENTLFLSGSDGTAAFKGAVYAQSGYIGGMNLYNGALCSGPYTDYSWPGNSTDIGSYFGAKGILLGNYATGRYFRADANGSMYMPGFTHENGQLTLTSSIIVNPNISGASFDSFAASLSGSAGGSFANTSSNVGYGTLTASPSGGRAPYTYQWTLTESSRTNTAYRMNVSGSTTGQSLALVGFGSNCTNEYRVTCIVTDANGRTATIGRSVTANHGTPP